MQPDEARRADTSAWLAKAQLDLRSAEHALAAAPPLREDVVFHCQQAVEKAMKGRLAFHDVPFRKTHSLEELGRQCVAVDPGLQPLADQAAPLTEYAWRFR
jgi:HEPN domain-containing protein